MSAISRELNPILDKSLHPRCLFASDKCKSEEPPLVEYAPQHSAACWHTEKVIEARAEFIQVDPSS